MSTTKAKDVFGELWEMCGEDVAIGTSLQDMLLRQAGPARHGFSGVPSQAFESYLNQRSFSPLSTTNSTYSVAGAEHGGTFTDGFQDHRRDLTRGKCYKTCDIAILCETGRRDLG